MGRKSQQGPGCYFKVVRWGVASGVKNRFQKIPISQTAPRLVCERSHSSIYSAYTNFQRVATGEN